MNELITAPRGETPATIPSTEVAEIIGKEHMHLMRDIRTYRDYLSAPKEDAPILDSPPNPADFFIESSYVNTQNKQQPCYLCTKMGCEFIAHKLTGQKGTLFTAAYVQRFNQMEQAGLNLNELSPTLQVLIQLETTQREHQHQLNAVNRRMDNVAEVLALSPTQWRKDASQLVTKIARKMGGTEHIGDVYAEIHKLVDERGGVSLATRLTNKRQRMAAEGVCKSTRDKLRKTDVIADDKKLIEIYIAIVKELAIKHGVTLDGDPQ
ncbi:MAG: Rha family transcriptional regulator [Oscillospiraceae bacterium]|jgi:Rha family phage regulatory protein|nr:Rha family transcriptional regulator [Oscillospiraceae bacterium]